MDWATSHLFDNSGNTQKFKFNYPEEDISARASFARDFE